MQGTTMQPIHRQIGTQKPAVIVYPSQQQNFVHMYSAFSRK